MQALWMDTNRRMPILALKVRLNTLNLVASYSFSPPPLDLFVTQKGSTVGEHSPVRSPAHVHEIFIIKIFFRYLKHLLVEVSIRI